VKQLSVDIEVALDELLPSEGDSVINRIRSRIRTLRVAHECPVNLVVQWSRTNLCDHPFPYAFVPARMYGSGYKKYDNEIGACENFRITVEERRKYTRKNDRRTA